MTCPIVLPILDLFSILIIEFIIYTTASKFKIYIFLFSQETRKSDQSMRPDFIVVDFVQNNYINDNLD